DPRHLLCAPVDAGPAPADRTARADGLPGLAVAAAAVYARPVQRPYPGLDLAVVARHHPARPAGDARPDRGRVAAAPTLARADAGDPVLLRGPVAGIQHGGVGAVLRTPQLPAGPADVLATGAVVVQRVLAPPKRGNSFCR